ncbi:hypothetical protein [Duganella levis]|uniref:DUF4760 domain-containing protein n=1 Tax=Duganella levis TaxID=2692169 RepID=A0ABW9VVF8_9BURK|nr:hypothetical protein [Duganella levis]MYN25557.1 hypothetical protein [Duganella levis]
MTEAQLSHYASWASIISLFISILSLLYLRSIKHNLIKFRRKRRIRDLLEYILTTTSQDSAESMEKLVALRRNLPMRAWSKFTARGRIVIELHRHIEAGDMAAVREVIYDWLSYSGDL